MNTTIVIPARYASTRLPHKMLLDETGWPLVRHVWEQAKKTKSAARVILATDDARIRDAALAFGADVVMTDPAHQTGTDRLAEVARTLSNTDLIVNVQGDEPEIEPDKIDALVALYAAAQKSGGADMATLVCPFPSEKTDGPGSPADPNCVKAVLGRAVKAGDTVLGFDALYFSRSLVPFPRDTNGAVKNGADYFLHLGIYAYAPAFLQKFVALPPGRMESVEKLEQLRALENGFRIVAGVSARATPGIDTRADYDAFVARWKATACLE